MGNIFNGGYAFCALQKKDYATAQKFYEAAFQSDPTQLQDVYQLAVADLEANPVVPAGLWYCGKAIALAREQNSPQAANGMSAYCKAKYTKYHGSEDGWDAILTQAGTQAAPPKDFGVALKPELTPCDLAVQTVKENDPNSLSMSDKEFILEHRDCSPEGKAAAQKVWESIETMEKNGAAKLDIPVTVISATQDTLMVAITDDNVQAKKADMQVNLSAPMRYPPAPGSAIDVIGVIVSYQLNPFRFVMTKAEVGK